MTEIYLIRHGEAEGNIFRRIHGQYNSLLTPDGLLQVELLRRRLENLRFDACFSSDLTRACQTARAVFVPNNLPLITSSAFRETDLGAWEDVPFGYLYNFEQEKMRAFNTDIRTWRSEGAETYDEFTQRMVDGITEAAQAYDGGRIAVFSHGTVTRCLLARLFFGGDPAQVPYSDNTGVSKLIFHAGEFTYDFLNDCSHVPESLSTASKKRRWWGEHPDKKKVNLYFLPYSPISALPAGLSMPDTDSDGQIYTGYMQDVPVGVVSLGKKVGSVGTMLGIAMDESLHGKGYAEQFLGMAISHFRSLGCTELRAAQVPFPDDLLNRYEFDKTTATRSLDAERFDWGTNQ